MKYNCYKCNKNKPFNQLIKDVTTKRGFHGYCKGCKYEIAKQRKGWLELNYKMKMTERRRQIKIKAIEFKGGRCVDCGYDKHPAALCFHHLGNKEFEISYLMKFGLVGKTIKELNKCVLLCHNCHDIRHYGKWKGRRHKEGENK